MDEPVISVADHHARLEAESLFKPDQGGARIFVEHAGAQG
jgi:hypothetical protein